MLRRRMKISAHSDCSIPSSTHVPLFPFRKVPGSYRGTPLLQTAMNAPLEDDHVWESSFFHFVTLQLLEVLLGVTEVFDGLRRPIQSSSQLRLRGDLHEERGSDRGHSAGHQPHLSDARSVPFERRDGSDHARERAALAERVLPRHRVLPGRSTTVVGRRG